MKKKELVLLLGKKNFLVKVGKGEVHTEFGVIDTSKMRKKFGTRVKSHTGEEFVVVEPTLLDLLEKGAKRLPQIVTPKDASLILAYTGIKTDSLVVDAGSGSGFLSMFLAHYCKDGEVVTYERNRKFAKVAEENAKLLGLNNLTLKRKDILKGISERDVDLITLDMKDAEKMVGKAHKALKTGGWLVVFSPYIEQAKRVTKELKKFNFTSIKTIENVTREWQVSNFTRPKTTGIMHTTFLTFTRKGK